MSNSQRELYDEIIKLIDIPNVMHILDSNDFFKEQYLERCVF
jgi:hypothetical protein